MPKTIPRRLCGRIPRVPLPWPPTPEGLQVNFCKQPRCPNYGKWPSTDYKNPFAGAKYRKGGGQHNAGGLTCKEDDCGKTFPMKNNQSVVDELERLTAYFHDKPRGCPDKKCPNHLKDVSLGKAYYIRYGTAPNGAPRYRCRECMKKTITKKGKVIKTRVFAVNNDPDPIRRQKAPEKNERIFEELLSKKTYRRLLDTERTGGGTVYGKINFFYKQCRAFAAPHERHLLEGTKMCFPRLYLSTDAQVYNVNWRLIRDSLTQRARDKGKQNVRITAIGTAEEWSGFVFAMNVNFDPEEDPLAIERETEGNNDYDLPVPYRRHARFWLKQDYIDVIARINKKEEEEKKKEEKKAKKRKRKKNKEKKKEEPRTLLQQIRQRMREAGERFNVDDSDVMTKEFKLPARGMQIHRDYLYLGHFLFLRRLLADNFGKIRFFFDPDSGIRSACLTAFQPEIKTHRADACYVAIVPDFPKHAARGIVSKAEKEFRDEEKKHENSKKKISKKRIRAILMIRKMKEKESDNYWGDWWVEHPCPTMSEPVRLMSFQTYYKGLGTRHLAHLYLKASLHSINSFFNFIRNRLASLKHGRHSASKVAKEFLQGNPYNPAVVVKLLEIARVYWNYAAPVEYHREHTTKMLKLVKEGKAKKNRSGRYKVPKKERKTRAMYLGLCDRPYGIEDILKFKPPASAKIQQNAVST